jgi:hypothetical protein
MWGSGKTWLGSYFLDQLSKHKRVCDKLKKDYGEVAVNRLLNAYYVLIDFRTCLNTTVHLDMEEFLKAQLIRHLLHLDETCDSRELLKSLEQDWKYLTISSIVDQFSKHYSRALFLHFDEIDLLLSNIAPALTADTPPLVSVNRLYKFWKFLTPALYDSMVYCSGRTSLLYALGRHLYEDKGITSPLSQSRCILLKPLKFRQILSLAHAARPDLNDEKCRRLAEQILFYTRGIPRLVGYAIDYVRGMHGIFSPFILFNFI